MSKEHAIAAPLAAVPLYILLARPSAKRVAVLSGMGSVLIATAAFVLWKRYGQILGKPFDEYSHVYLAQLQALDPGVEKNAYGLSVINQSYLFFQYGLRWLFPYTGWMSINLRPPFPVTWLTFPQILGAVGYLATLVGGFFLLLRYRDWRALIGISILFPALLFATEFATVWVQDPFSLYRSYLWAIGIPGVVFFVLHGPSARVLLAIGLVLASLLTWQAIDRVFSMATVEGVWTDAIEKLPRDPRSVGRWFPYLNRGAAYVDREEFQLALRDFESSAALGDGGLGTFNQGAVLLTTGKPVEAIAAFDRAEKEGYGLYNLPFQRGMALMALGKVPDAYRDFTVTQQMDPPSPTREILWLQAGRAALQLRKARRGHRRLRQAARGAAGQQGGEVPASDGVRVQGRCRGAPRELLDAWLAEGNNAPALYARAMANYGLKRKAEALADIDGAMRLGLDNQAVRQWKARIEAMP